ncbi:hypothetical protein OF83DRAFT_1043403, partial [Amylostereum chailletii]
PREDRWSTSEGRLHLKFILDEAIPQWPNGPHDWQVEVTSNLLDQHHQLLVAGCGEGKTAAMYLQIMLYRYLREHPWLNRLGLPLVENPIILAVTPLTDLAHSQVSDMS